MSGLRLILLPVLGGLLCCAMGAAVTATQSAKLIRKEPKALDIDRGGKMTQLGAKAGQKEETKTDYCNYDFPLGTEDGNACSDPRDHIMEDKGDCEQAATQANAHVSIANFEISSDWYHKFAKGCFMEPCTEAVNEICYFYNGVDSVDTNVRGTAVCKRPRLLEGTANTVGNDEHCPTNYQAVKDATLCANFGTCLGKCHTGSDNFRIAIINADLYHNYPKYCFISEVDGCVYYNEPLAGMGEPTDPKGTPICNVTSITKFGDTAANALDIVKAAPISWGGTGSHHDGTATGSAYNATAAAGQTATSAPSR